MAESGGGFCEDNEEYGVILYTLFFDGTPMIPAWAENDRIKI